MNSSTKAFLRKAVSDALSQEQDDAALEILQILSDASEDQSSFCSPPALPAAKQVLEGPAHDYHYWVQFIKNEFLPFMNKHARDKFTSHELLGWIERHQSVLFTTGDIEMSKKGRETWRNIVSNALSHLKAQGVFFTPPFGKDYTIRDSSINTNFFAHETHF